MPTAKELRENPSSRSAKLRYLIKKDNFYNFETDITKKFDYLLKLEEFGKNYEKISVILVLSLILFTALIKNSTKRIDDKIFT